MQRRDVAALLALAALWGGSFLFIRVAAPALGPLPLAAGRVLLGGLVLWAGLRASGHRPAIRPHARQLLLLGLLNASLPYALIAAAELRLTASLTAMLNATIPAISAVLGVALLGERLTPRRTTGLAVGVAGVALTVGWTPVAMTWATAASVAATLLACVSYAVATVYAKKALAGVPTPTLALGQQLGAAVWLVPFAAWQLPRAHPTAPALLALLALAILSTAVAYLLYFRLVANVGPTKTATVAYLFPAFGTLWGALLLHESVTPGMLAGFALILGSVVLVNEVRWARAARPPAAAPGSERAA